MFSRTGGVWERELVTFRIVAVLPDGRCSTAEQPRDAGWLIRRGARAEAIGFGLGQLVSDGDDLRVRTVELLSLSRADTAPQAAHLGDEHADDEEVLLQGAAQQLAKLNNPLIVTCGGRALDLPFLRYRSLAKSVSLGQLHLSLGNKLNYFDRNDQNWHLDISDLFAGYGASRPLMLEDLCELCGIGRAARHPTAADRAQHEAALLLLLFLNTLRLMDRLSFSEHARARRELAALADSSRSN